MNESALIPFHFRNRTVRGLTIEGEPWFVAKDVCNVLELSNITEALRSLDDDELTSELLKSGGQQREMKLVSESGLYALVFKSRKPEARAFRKWVTSEVLPALRKRRRYEMPDAPPEDYAPFRGNRADIYHHRGPVSRSGLDIRYALDLTRIALNPNPRSLEVLQRLTGVDMDDLIEEMESAGGSGKGRDAAAAQRGFMDDWFEFHCEAAPGRGARFSVLYESLENHYKTEVGQSGAFPMPSRNALSRYLVRRGCLRGKPCGFATVYGVRLSA